MGTRALELAVCRIAAQR